MSRTAAYAMVAGAGAALITAIGVGYAIHGQQVERAERAEMQRQITVTEQWLRDTAWAAPVKNQNSAPRTAAAR